MAGEKGADKDEDSQEEKEDNENKKRKRGVYKKFFWGKEIG